MAKTQPLLTAFNAGEYTNEGMARVDQDRVRLAAEIQENIFPDVTGAGQVRPGTQFLGNTASDNQARLIPFVKSIDDTAVLELSNNLLRVWVDDALVTRPSVTSTVDNGDFSTPSATVTISIASPALVTWTGSNLPSDTPVSFETTGALPTGLSVGTTYYVISQSTNTFNVAATAGGAAINTSGSQSGTHTGYRGWTFDRQGSPVVKIEATGELNMEAFYNGGSVTAFQEVSTSSSGTQHAVKIVVDRGPITFRCGATKGADELIAETVLDKGEHRLAFTPSGSTYFLWFFTNADRDILLSNVTIESSGVMTIAAPWTAAQLQAIEFDQSGDIVFLANESWQQRKIERRGDDSWSLAYFEANDGPFTLVETATAKLSITATRGNTTMSADRPFFTDNHEGALFRLFHDNHEIQARMAGLNAVSDAFRVQGVGTDRNWTFTMSGTWTGTVLIERSYDGPDFGFVTEATHTVNASTTVADGLDNSEVWYRFRFSAYSSGELLVAGNWRGGGGWGVVRITAVNSSTSVDVEVLDHTDATGEASEWLEGEWSDHRGWPSSIAFFDGRLWFGALDKFWSSESDAFTTFTPDGVGDSASIQRSIATGGSINAINWMLPLQRLVFGTDGAEASARASTIDQPLTPTNIGVKNASSQGVAPVSPVNIDGRGIFVQRSKRRIYEIAFSGEANDYRSDNLTKFNEDIGGDGINELAVQRQPEPYVWHVRADGQAPVLIYDPTEQVAGWIRYIAAASVAGAATIESITVLPEDEQDAIYLAIKRTIDGSTVRFIEKLAKHSEAEGGATNKMADAGSLTAGPVTSVTLAHLANETGLIGWGTNGSGDFIGLTGLSANGSGVISLGASYTNVWVGLKYSWRYKSAKLAYGAQFGTALMQPKKVNGLALLMKKVHKLAVNYGEDFDNTFPMPAVEDFETVADNTVHELYDEYSFPFVGNWDTDSRVHLKGDAPYPATLLAMAFPMDTNERL